MHSFCKITQYDLLSARRVCSGPRGCCKSSRQLFGSQACLSNHRFDLFVVKTKNGLKELYNYTLIHLMHWISHAHLINAKALDRPERVIDQMAACLLTATLVILRGWPWNHFLGLRMPCNNRPTPGIPSCNLIVYSLTMFCSDAGWGISSAQKISLLDPAPKE